MTIKFAEQVFCRSDRITIISCWGKEFELAFRAGRQRRDFFAVFQDDELALNHWHGRLDTPFTFRRIVRPNGPGRRRNLGKQVPGHCGERGP